MEELSWHSIIWYGAFSILVFYQQLHSKNIRGSSQVFEFALNLSAFLGMLTGIVYLIYYGWTVVWWASLAIFFIGLAATTVGVIVEKFTGAFALSLLAFFGWPVCAYLMFYNIPQN